MDRVVRMTTHRDVVEQFLRENGHPRAEVWRVCRDDQGKATAVQWTEQTLFGYAVEAGAILPWDAIGAWEAAKQNLDWDDLYEYERGVYYAWLLEPESPEE